MSGKHTPAPWTVVSDETVTVRDVGDGCIASCGWLTGRFTGPRRSSVEVHANARLIAAAPEMLELVKMVHGSFGGGLVVTFSEQDAQAFAAAIAKAEGQS